MTSHSFLSTIEVLLRKEITLLLKRQHFNVFVVSRSHLGIAEVESSSGEYEEKLTSSERGKFSGFCYVLLIVVLEMNILLDIIAIGPPPHPPLSYICVINSLSLCAHQLFWSSVWINISLGDFHSPVGSCLPAIKAGIWKWPSSLWHSKCIQITQHQSQCISNTLLYHHPSFAYVSESFTNSILCSYKYHCEWRDTPRMHNAGEKKNSFNTAVLDF